MIQPARRSEEKLAKVQDSTIEHYRIGLKLRTLRSGKHFTLAQLAMETGFSSALLSKLESGRMIPTLTTLARISSVYGVSLSYFFSDATRHSVSITRRGHIAAIRGSQEMLRRIPLHYDHIGSTRCGASLIGFPPGLIAAASEPGQGFSGLVYVIEGKLDLDIGGTKEVLDAGDCACIDTDMIVGWGSATQEDCQILLVKV